MEMAEIVFVFELRYVFGSEGAQTLGDGEASAPFGLDEGSRRAGSRVRGDGDAQQLVDLLTDRGAPGAGSGCGNPMELGIESDGEPHGRTVVQWCSEVKWCNHRRSELALGARRVAKSLLGSRTCFFVLAHLPIAKSTSLTYLPRCGLGGV